MPAAADLDFIGPPPVRDRPRPVEAEDPGGRDFTEVEFWLRGIGEADFTDQQGQLTTQRGGWRAAVGRYQPGGTSYAFGVFTEASFYDFGGGESPVPGVSDPFNDVYEMSIAGRFLVEQNEKLEWYGGIQLALAGEDRSELSDSVVVGGALAMRYRAAPQFSLLAGIAGMSRFDDSPWILPYLGFDWQVTDSLRILTEAAEIHVDYQLGRSWTLGAVTAYEFRQYRLNEEGPLHGGSVRDEEIRLGGSLGWKPGGTTKFEIEAGTLLWREMFFNDGQSGLVAESETSSPLYLRLGLSLSF